MLQGTPGMSGATITGDGRIALILDVPSMLKRYARTAYLILARRQGLKSAAACLTGVFMVVKVLVVDDSGVFRRRVSEILSADPSIQVVGTATNGKEAIDQALALKPDVITMDYEMPMMDGITAVRHIMQRCPTPVLMFSSLTHEGAG